MIWKLPGKERWIEFSFLVRDRRPRMLRGGRTGTGKDLLQPDGLKLWHSEPPPPPLPVEQVGEVNPFQDPLYHGWRMGARRFTATKLSGRPMLCELTPTRQQHQKHHLACRNGTTSRSAWSVPLTCLTIWLGHFIRICMGHQSSSAIRSRNHCRKHTLFPLKAAS